MNTEKPFSRQVSDNNEGFKSRRDFIRKTVAGSAFVSFGGILPGFTPKSYGKIIGANEKVRVGMMGVNSRGLALSTNYALQPNCEVVSVSDVDTRAAEKCISAIEGITKSKPANTPDFRKALENKDMDALVIAAPDHWHAPAAILASKAGKHVYLEKPCSHNPHEGELLLEVSKKYKNVIQMGNQRRSWPNVAAGIKEVHDGAIGRPYFVKGWYTNNRASIGIGKETAVPSWLNYDLCRVLLLVALLRTTWFTITGIGSGTGERVKRLTMAPICWT